MLPWLIVHGALRQVQKVPDPSQSISIYPERLFNSDLMVTGLVADLPSSGIGYVRYADLAALPLATFAIRNDENFPARKDAPPLRVQGIYLDDLIRAIGVLPASDMISASCSDHYQTHYSSDYVARHRPLLGLTLDHSRTEVWASRRKAVDPGPYFVTHEGFKPSFHVLSHADQPQVPTNVVRLDFSTIAATYGAIAPRGTYSSHSLEMDGFVIARQNCLRCHNQGSYGGTKAGRDWTTLSTWAREQPAYFEDYVHNPKTFEPYSKMPPNPTYDRTTLHALTAYFRTFTGSPVLEQ